MDRHGMSAWLTTDPIISTYFLLSSNNRIAYAILHYPTLSYSYCATRWRLFFFPFFPLLKNLVHLHGDACHPVRGVRQLWDRRALLCLLLMMIDIAFRDIFRSHALEHLR